MTAQVTSTSSMSSDETNTAVALPAVEMATEGKQKQEGSAVVMGHDAKQTDSAYAQAPAMPSPAKGMFMVASAVLITLCTAGIVFGYSALKPVFIREGAYGYKCPPGESGCTEQVLTLNLMFFIGSIAVALAALMGIVADYVGPRMMSVAGTVFEIIGLVLMAFSSDDFPAYTVGFCFLAFGGLAMLLAHLHLVNLFPKYFGLINGAISGAFDASALIFLIFKSIANTGVPLKTIWLGYIVVPLLNLVFGLSFLGPKAYQSNFDSVSLISTAASDDKKKKRTAPKMYELSSLTVKQQLLSYELMINVFWVFANMLRFNFYIATVSEQLYDLVPAEHHETLLMAFDVILPAVGLGSVPFVGYILDYMGTISMIWVIIATQSLSGAMQLIPIWWVQIPQMVIFVFCRACLYSASTDFLGRMFGFKTFGRTYGVTMCVSGLSNLVSYFLDKLVKEQLGGVYTWVNVALTILFLTTLVNPIYLWRKNRAWLAEREQARRAP